MSDGAAERLRVLIANQQQERLEQIGEIVRGLGHDVVALELDVANVAALTRETQPDVAFVGLGNDSQHALDLIGQIVQEATCPVIAVLDSSSTDFVRDAAEQGVFASVSGREPDVLQGAIDVVLRRFADYSGLEGAFGRRAVIERAKGILMARHEIAEQPAFELLRQTSQRESRKLVDVAQGVIDNYLLLPAAPVEPSA